MDFKHHIETAWTLTLANIVPLILLTLVMAAVSFLTLGILAPVITAGYFQSLLLLLRSGREPKIQDLFSHMRLFLPLLIFGLAIAVLAVIGFALLFLPGILFLLAVALFCTYMLPLMTDQNMGVIDAVKESYAMSRRGEFMDHIVVVILFSAVTTIGGSFFVGMLFTQPLATLFLLSVYEEKINAPIP